MYARERGSVAAPTAGLHFTAELLEAIAARGVDRIAITLHVGYGTFKPVRVDASRITSVDPEPYEISAGSGGRDRSRARRGPPRDRRRHDDDACARGCGGTRRRQSCAPVEPRPRSSSIPATRFRVVDGLLTNFHLPQSSLLMLVAAFAGRERVLAAYTRGRAAALSLLQLRGCDG